MEISKFHEKLNKIDGNIYVVEEKVELTGGVYDALLQHDNINTSTISVYTGPKLTGERIQTYTLSTPSLTSWKRTIRIYADVPTVYISYEAEGDTVEAEDVNRLQEEVVRTQEAVNAEITRAGEAERDIASDLTAEITRAQTAEQTIAGNLTAEISRAKGAEQELSGSLTTEITRAKAAEKINADNLTTETTRAKAVENVLTENLSTEKSRALVAEALLESKKANVSDVNSELSNRYTKDQTYSRQEILDKIEALIGSAPETLDTFQEVAKALGEDPNFATTIITILSGKVDKEDGKGLSANDYSDSEQAMLADVYNKKHTHSNKSTIDKITETLLSRWNDAYEKRHEHENKGILDTITQTLLDNWNAAFTHISDTVKHITATERTNWNDSNSKKHTHANKSILDGITQTLVDRWNAAYAHVSDTVRHVTPEERESWNTVSNKVDSVPGMGLSSNDYTDAAMNKLSGISPGAEVNVQADWNVTDTASDAYIKNKPTSLPASDVSAWAKAASKPTYSWSEVSGKPSSFTPAAHSHTKSQITDMPTKLSQFENDSSYITAADIDTSQNHTHTNKSVLDSITQTLLNGWNAAYAHVSNKSNPHGVTASQTGAAATVHTHVKNDVTDFPSSMPASGGDSATVNGHTVSADVPAGAKFTDTVYAHPNSGVTAGTYKSVTVNAQGHVTAGSNPTTLFGYGITDAAPKTHNHDDAYLKKTGLTWNDLKGV